MPGRSSGTPHASWPRWLIILFAAGLLTAGTLPACADEPLGRYEFLQIEMGVPFRIVLYAGNQDVANKAADAAYARIEQLNGIMSDYDPDSELMRLCRTAGSGKAVKVSPDLERVLAHALKLSRKTDGAFDVTVGPLVRLWRIARRKKQMPAADALRAARRLVGHQHVQLDRKAHTVVLEREGMRLDLGGIAKGYAGDAALQVLKRHGITKALIDGSGDIVLGDPPPGKRGWTIAVGGEVRGGAGTKKSSGRPPKPVTLTLSGAAVATSGDAFQFVEIDGRRYSHIIDPATGLGLTQSSSVTIIAEDGMTADSLASAVSVLGPRQGFKLVEACPRRAAQVIRVEAGTPRRYATDSFEKYPAND